MQEHGYASHVCNSRGEEEALQISPPLVSPSLYQCANFIVFFFFVTLHSPIIRYRDHIGGGCWVHQFVELSAINPCTTESSRHAATVHRISVKRSRPAMFHQIRRVFSILAFSILSLMVQHPQEAILRAEIHLALCDTCICACAPIWQPQPLGSPPALLQAYPGDLITSQNTLTDAYLVIPSEPPSSLLLPNHHERFG